MKTKLNHTVQIAKTVSLAALLSASMATSAFAAEAGQSPIDPSTLALFAIGLASLVATRKRVR